MITTSTRLLMILRRVDNYYNSQAAKPTYSTDSHLANLSLPSLANHLASQPANQLSQRGWHRPAGIARRELARAMPMNTHYMHTPYSATGP